MKEAIDAPLPLRRTLHFPTILELVHFEMRLHRGDTEVDRKSHTITGYFTTAEIEEAEDLFAAVELH
jgi:hypothetical protein